MKRWHLWTGLSALCLTAGTAAMAQQGREAAQPAMAAGPATAAEASFGNYSPAPEYDGYVSNSLYLPMRDGVRLAVRIDRPARGGKAVEGRFPVIWHHSLSITQERADGVGDRITDYRRMQELTKYGYVVVQVARRGNGQSFGAMRGYHDRNEAQDAFEVTQWLGEQPWSTGRVGVYGCSNTGDAAMHVMTTRPPALKAVFAGCFSWHKYDAFRRGGVFAQWGTGPSRTLEQDMAIDPVDGDEDKTLLAQAARQHRNSTPLFEMWKQLPYRDSWSPLVSSRFWEEGSVARYADQIRLSEVPVYIQGGWFDELRDQGIAAQLNIPGSRLLIGPWTHCDNDGFPLLEEIHRFFDQHLKGMDTGIDDQPPIHYFTMDGNGGGQWRAAETWPLPQADRVQYNLGPTTLSEAPEQNWTRSFKADFSVDCPNFGSGPRAQPCHIDGAGLSFAASVLERAREITGSPEMELWVTLDSPDANLFAYLEDVAPDGTVTVVTEGRQKVSLRKTQEAPWALPEGTPWHRSYAEDQDEVAPGEKVRLSFAMMPTSYVFQPGHRIQVTVTGADWRERVREPANPPQIELSGGDQASTVILPFIG